MSSLVENIVQHYHTAMEAGDPRTADWLFISTPWSALGLVCLYLMVVMVGPQVMKSREAFKINKLLVAFNFGLVLLSLYMFLEYILSVSSIPGFSFWCQGVDPGSHPSILRHARVSWLFFFSKFVEFFDTIFFILRKKNNQISFLRVYHHSSVPLMWWIVVKWSPGGTSFFGGSFNCFVHVVMYFYYMLSAFGPQYRKYLWWKKYVTILQLLQFNLDIIHISYAMTIQDCTFPRWLLRLLFCYALTLNILFINFYYQEYANRPAEKKELKSR